MHININKEILKIRIHDQVSKFLKDPSEFHKHQLHTLLLEYREIFHSSSYVEIQDRDFVERVVSQ